MPDKQSYIITIDGPGGSGKGSLAVRVAGKLNFHLLDSGAIYRLAALHAMQHGIDLKQESKVTASLDNLDIRFEIGDELSIPYLNDVDVSKQIRLESSGEAASVIARYAGVRKHLLGLQQGFFQDPGLVADGRDMGTVVFQQARFKFFLSASVEIRALRRYKQLIGMGLSANIDRLRSDISARDERDKNRTESPLIPAVDAIIIDSSLLDLEQVVDLVMSHINEVNELVE